MTGIAWNEDWAQFFVFSGDDAMDESHLRSWIHQYADTQVRELILNVNGMRASYNSRVIGSISDQYDPADPEAMCAGSESGWECVGQRKWIRHVHALQKKGINPFSVFVSEARAIGVSPFISLRVNDMHGVMDESCFLHDALWRTHPEYRTGEYRYPDTLDLYDRTLDYAHAQVRARLLALARECLELYDMDGLELDFVRNDVNFRRGFEQAGIPVMNGLIAELRAELNAAEKARGHAIQLAVRVPCEPDQALSWGLDVHAWVKTGAVSYVTAMNHYDCPLNTAPYVLWRKLLGDGVTLCGGMDVGMRAHPKGHFHRMTLETVRGAADAMLEKGVDRVYLFNYHAGHSALRETGAILREVGRQETLKNTFRRFVCGYHDSHFCGEPQPSILPIRFSANELHDVRVDLGCVDNEEITIRLGLAGVAFRKPQMTVRLNGQECPYDDWIMSPDPGPGRELYEFRAPAGAAHRGQNNIEVIAREPLTLDWCEADASPYGFDELLGYSHFVTGQPAT